MKSAREIIHNLQLKTIEHNRVAEIAFIAGCDYITPEDVKEAFSECNSEDEVNKIRLDVLEVMANGTGFGIEDNNLTAFVAFQGKN